MSTEEMSIVEKSGNSTCIAWLTPRGGAKFDVLSTVIVLRKRTTSIVLNLRPSPGYVYPLPGLFYEMLTGGPWTHGHGRSYLFRGGGFNFRVTKGAL